jgi:hypothetical protein
VKGQPPMPFCMHVGMHLQYALLTWSDDHGLRATHIGRVSSHLKHLFGGMCIHLNPHVSKCNGMEFSSITLQFTSTYAD